MKHSVYNAALLVGVVLVGTGVGMISGPGAGLAATGGLVIVLTLVAALLARGE